MTSIEYPRWIYYPNCSEPDKWTQDLVNLFFNKKDDIDSTKIHKKSNEVLSIIQKDLEKIGFIVEEKKSKIPRPVHFGEYGIPDRTYQIDSYNPNLKIGLEIESGRSHLGNAIYRDIIQTSLLVDVDYLALGVPQIYRFKSKGRSLTEKTYEICKSVFDAIYTSNRLVLPLKGVLLIGY